MLNLSAGPDPADTAQDHRLLGGHGNQVSFDPGATVNRERGMWKYADGVWMLATYHPAALLRNQARKEAAWEDMKKLQEKIHELGLYS